MVRRRRRNPQGPKHPPASKASGVSDLQEQHILAALADLRDASVSEVMTPRVDVVGLPIPVHAADVAQAVRESGHSCFPVYDDDMDNLVGLLYVNDLFRAGAGWAVDTRSPEENGNGGSEERPSPIDISRRLRQPYLVPESHLVLDVLAEMRRVRRTFAVVVDEYGGVAGVVTVKDLLAALVGDLYDEFDPGGEPEFVARGPQPMARGRGGEHRRGSGTSRACVAGREVRHPRRVHLRRARAHPLRRRAPQVRGLGAQGGRDGPQAGGEGGGRPAAGQGRLAVASLTILILSCV